MATTLLVGAGVVAFVISALIALPGKMLGDELRARVDDLPVLFVRLALRLLPEDMRTDYKVDWESNLLAAFNDKTAKYPVTRFVRSFKFGFSLLLGSRQIRKETKVGARQRNLGPDELRAVAAYWRTRAGELGVGPAPVGLIKAIKALAAAEGDIHPRLRIIMVTENMRRRMIAIADELDEKAANGLPGT